MKVTCIALALQLVALMSLAQDQKIIDSLERIFPGSKGVDRFDIANDLSYQYILKNDTMALYYCNEFIRAANSLGDSANITYATRRKGIMFRRLDNSDSALYFYHSALAIARRNKVEDEHRLLLNSMGIVYQQLAEYEKALDAYSESLVLARQAADSSLISLVLNNIGVLHYKLHNNELAISAYKEALVIRLKIKKTSELDRLYINLGLAYREVNDFEKSEQNIRKGLSVCEGNCDDRIMSEALQALGILNTRRHRYSEALQNLEQAYAYAKKTGSDRYEIECLNSLGALYIEQKAFNNAARVLAEAERMSRDHGYNDLLLNAYEWYVGLYEAKGDYANVVKSQEHIIELERVIHSASVSERTARFQMDYEMNKRKTMIASQHDVMAAREKAIVYRYYVLVALIVAGVLFIIFIILLYRQYQNKRKIGVLLEERVAARTQLLQRQEAQVAQDYRLLQHQVQTRTHILRTKLTNLITTDGAQQSNPATHEYLEKIRMAASECLGKLSEQD